MPFRFWDRWEISSLVTLRGTIKFESLLTIHRFDCMCVE
jgi:hypothetical protein